MEDVQLTIEESPDLALIPPQTTALEFDDEDEDMSQTLSQLKQKRLKRKSTSLNDEREKSSSGSAPTTTTTSSANNEEVFEEEEDELAELEQSAKLLTEQQGQRKTRRTTRLQADEEYNGEDENGDDEPDEEETNDEKFDLRKSGKRKVKEDDLRDKVYAEFKRRTDVKSLVRKHRKDRMFDKQDYLTVLNEAKAVTKQNKILLTTPVLTADVLVNDYRQEPEKSQKVDLLKDSLLNQLQDENATYSDSDESDSDFELVIEKKIDVVTTRDEPMSDEDYDDEDDDEDAEDEGDAENQEKDHEEGVQVPAQDQAQEETTSTEETTTTDRGNGKDISMAVHTDSEQAVATADAVADDVQQVGGDKTHVDCIMPTLDAPLPSLSVTPNVLEEELEVQPAKPQADEVEGGIEFESDEEEEDDVDEDEKLLDLKEKKLLAKEKRAKITMLKSSEWNEMPASDDEEETDFVDRECIEDNEEEEAEGMSGGAMMDDEDVHLGENEMEEIGNFIVMSDKIEEIDAQRARRLRRKAEMLEDVIRSDDEEDEREEAEEEMEGDELERWNQGLLNPVSKTSYVPGSVNHADILKQITNESTGTFSRFSKRSAELIKNTIQSVQQSLPELLSSSANEEREQRMRIEYLQEKKRLEEERRKNTKRLLDNFRMIRKRQKKLREQSLSMEAESMGLTNEYDGDLYDFSSEEETETRITYQPKSRTISYAPKANADQSQYTEEENTENDEIPSTSIATMETEESLPESLPEPFESLPSVLSDEAEKENEILAPTPSFNLFGQLPASALSSSNKRRRSEEVVDDAVAAKKRKVASMTMHGQRISSRGSFLNGDVSAKGKKFAKQYKKNLKQDKQYEATSNPKALGQFTKSDNQQSRKA